MNPIAHPAGPQPPAAAGGQAAPTSKARVVVVDSKPLSLLATAGVLHHHRFECLCARSIMALDRAIGLEPHAASSATVPGPSRPADISPLAIPTRSRLVTPPADPAAPVDLLVWDVGEDADSVLDHLDVIRRSEAHRDLPAILIAEPRWSGLQLRTQSMATATYCVFKPIDTRTLISLVEQLTWMPAVASGHRRSAASRNSRGWVSLTS